MSESSSPDSFEELGLSAPFVTALRQIGHERPTRVQALAIPAAMAGRDVRARAETGSGKTLAFGLPLLHQLTTLPRAFSQRGNPVATLVLAPTRELAIQIADVLSELSASANGAQGPRSKVLAVYGGVSVNPQMMAMRGGADVLVATPGRLLDLHRQNAVELGAVRVLVLDEADRMLGLGFHDELQEILALLPRKRQNLLFSATFPVALEPLMREMLANPVEIDLPPVDTLALIEQHVYIVEQHRKYSLLTALIEQRALDRVLVFASAKRTADKVAEKLNRAGVSAAVFHADRSHAERQRVLDAFKSKQLRVLVATDLAGRGIDIEDLPTVVNFELPRSPNDYTHRIGRTGRAGKAGLAISLISSDEYQHFGVIEKRLKRKFPREQLPGFEVPDADSR
jgi:superfamily II DNA/RNA helicase